MKSLFFDKEAVVALNNSLEGQITPRIWGQGSTRCIVCKPSPRLIVGLFCREESSALEFYEWAQTLEKDIRAIVSSNDE